MSFIFAFLVSSCVVAFHWCSVYGQGSRQRFLYLLDRQEYGPEERSWVSLSNVTDPALMELPWLPCLRLWTSHSAEVWKDLMRGNDRRTPKSYGDVCVQALKSSARWFSSIQWPERIKVSPGAGENKFTVVVVEELNLNYRSHDDLIPEL